MLTSSWQKLMGRLSGRHKVGLFSIGWTTAGQFLGLFIRLASNLILTRLLAPEAYGILGSAMAVLTTLEWLSDIGVQPALVRHPKGDRPEYLITGWWTNLGRGCLLALIAAVCAWPWATFCRQPELFAVLLVMSARPILYALRSPGVPLLRRNMQYRRLFADEIALTFCGTVASVILGIIFRSVWAIVLGTMIGTVASIFVSYFLCPIAPRLTWDREAFREIYDLGHQVFVNTLFLPLVKTMGIVGLAMCMLISTTVLTLTQTAFLYRRNWHGFAPMAATLFWMAAGLAVMLRVV